MNNAMQRSLLWVVAAAFILLGINRLFHYNNNRSLELEAARLSRGIETGDRLADHHDAVRYYKDLKPAIPEVHLRILQRQWLIALEILDDIRIAQSNTSLAKEVPLLYDRLSKHLRDMEERCDLVLDDTDALRAQIGWRIFNVRAVVKTVASLVVLETEENLNKVQRTLKEAIADLKSAIDAVDGIASANLEKNICRWNLEILGQQQGVKKGKSPETEVDHHLGLQENLEAIIPEKAGYTSGKVLGREMRK